eukprot:3419903-Rhodomonas_salina.1
MARSCTASCNSGHNAPPAIFGSNLRCCYPSQRTTNHESKPQKLGIGIHGFRGVLLEGVFSSRHARSRCFSQQLPPA